MYTLLVSDDPLWWILKSLKNIDADAILQTVNRAMEDFGMTSEKEKPRRFHEAMKFATDD